MTSTFAESLQSFVHQPRPDGTELEVSSTGSRVRKRGASSNLPAPKRVSRPNHSSLNGSHEQDCASSSTSSRTGVLASPSEQDVPPSVKVVPAKGKLNRQSSSYAPPSRYAHIDNKLRDIICPGLICLFVGLNPGIRTATVGHAYAHPSNLFWKLLHASRVTPRLCLPEEDVLIHELYRLGNTNIVQRPTKDGSELSKAEMEAGVEILEAKTRTCKPKSVCIVGKSIWESIFKVWMGKKNEEGRLPLRVAGQANGSCGAHR